jgi:hypothetical protein
MADNNGSNQTTEPNEARELGAAPRNPFIIEIISAVDIPMFESRSKSDPYIQAYVSAHVGKPDSQNRMVYQLQRVSAIVQTPRRLDCSSVVWNCYRDLNIKPTTESVLSIELYHKSKEMHKADSLLGKVDIRINELVDENPKTFLFTFVKVRCTRIEYVHLPLFFLSSVSICRFFALPLFFCSHPSTKRTPSSQSRFAERTSTASPPCSAPSS